MILLMVMSPRSDQDQSASERGSTFSKRLSLRTEPVALQGGRWLAGRSGEMMMVEDVSRMTKARDARTSLRNRRPQLLSIIDPQMTASTGLLADDTNYLLKRVSCAGIAASITSGS
jgi:hypothetical protein